ncbi:hypothetical protein V1517DRAFT_311726 [Lipomyces orientalis]|uniref:Uncharacterized protein n=1 Tax=Lipomyces orientalis TaxID=1233043 RepID=A0ACC3U015_9ASCO
MIGPNCRKQYRSTKSAFMALALLVLTLASINYRRRLRCRVNVDVVARALVSVELLTQCLGVGLLQFVRRPYQLHRTNEDIVRWCP